MKACSKCFVAKPLAAFNRCAAASDGLRSECKDCAKHDRRKYYIKNAERLIEKQIAYHNANADRINEHHRARNKTPSGKASYRAYVARNPVKRAAHNAVNTAIQSGRLISQPCETCANPKTHAHHDDYSKPLDVRWLCRKHHAEWHRHNTPKCPDQEIAA